MRLFLLISFSVAASISYANQVLVSVGQLEDSTRLVLTFEDRPEWKVSNRPKEMTLTFEATALEVDIENGNNFVVGTRISQLTLGSEGRSITFELNCDCKADVYPYGASSLIVEVKESVVLADVRDVLLNAPRQPEPPVSIEEFDLKFQESGEQVARPTVVPLASVDSLFIYPPNLPDLSWRSSGLKLDLVETLGFSMGSETESQAVTLLSRGLSRASAQGLVNAQPPMQRPTGGSRTRNDHLLDGRSNLSIVTGFERSNLSGRSSTGLTDQGRVCYQDSEVDLMAWGDTNDFRTLGLLRKEATAESGSVLPEGAFAIARYYIALGFGAEAKNVATYMNAGFQKDLVLAMADIVDHGSSSSDVFDAQIFCDGKVALWAALAKPIATGAAPASGKSILATFSAWPPHLRAHLGPVLAERLRSLGLEDEARNAVNAVARGGLQSNESELVTARMELGGTRPDKARGTLVEISNGTDVTAAEALLELLLDAERRNMAPNPAWVEDAPSLARATEGTEIAGSVNLAGLRGRIELDQFDKLRQALEERTPGLNDTTRTKLAISALVAAAQRANDEAFLRSELGFSKIAKIEAMDRAARLIVAERLLGIGLPERAEKYLPTSPETVEEAQIVAGILDGLGRTDQAIELLSQHTETENLRRLAQLLSQTGMNEQALQAFQKSGALRDAIGAAMRAGDWDWLSENGNIEAEDTLAETTQILTVPLPEVEESNQPMNGALIGSSQERRKSARELLERTRLSDS